MFFKINNIFIKEKMCFLGADFYLYMFLYLNLLDCPQQ